MNYLLDTVVGAVEKFPLCHVNPESAYLVLKWLREMAAKGAAPTPCVISDTSLVL